MITNAYKLTFTNDRAKIIIASKAMVHVVSGGVTVGNWVDYVPPEGETPAVLAKPDENSDPLYSKDRAIYDGTIGIYDLCGNSDVRITLFTDY